MGAKIYDRLIRNRQCTHKRINLILTYIIVVEKH